MVDLITHDDVAFWHLTDIVVVLSDVRFWE